MKRITVVVPNSSGLHARPARVFVNAAKKFKSTIHVQHGDKKANAKSMISLLTLGVEQGAEIHITAEGEDEDVAVAELAALVSSGMGEHDAPVAPAASPTTPEPASQTPPPPAPAHAPDQANVLRGLPASPGLAIGTVWQWRAPALLLPDVPFRSVPEEQDALARALAEAETHLHRLAKKMEQEAGAEEAAIFTAHLEILHDPDLLADVHARIADGVGAALAWQECIERRAEHLARVSDPLLAARAADVRDVGRLVLRLLLGVEEEAPALPGHPVILVADDLSPSDMANLDKRRILGICTARGTPTAHVAILARALGLPAVVGVGEQVLTLENGTTAILDGDQGRLILNPDKEVIEKARADLEKRQQTLKQAQQDAMLPAVTTDGHRVEVAANIGAPAEAHEAVQKGAEGVGLLRTEFLFLHRSQPPSEEEQAQVYRQIVEAMQNRPVIVRTLDVGGDKPAPYLPLPPEDNPFLGIRGIRLSLQYPDLLRQQLRALLRASEAGALRIMFPMITTLEDWQQARAVLDEVLAETGAAPVPVGIMVEVPAVALLADVFAREVDFFSIGTNDLTQYTLAMDRQHAQLAAQADGLHPAVLRLIDATVKAAHAAQKWVGVCGELAADEAALPILVGLGVDEVSVSVSLVPLVKARIRRLNFAQCRQLAQQALKCATASQVRELARQFWLEHA